jgi:hypothetical protein
LAPITEQLAACEHALVPYADIKDKLTEARALYRTLTAEFMNELKSRCDALNADQKRAIVLELFAQDVREGLDVAVAEKRQELVRYIEALWGKYRRTMKDLRSGRQSAEDKLRTSMDSLGYQ